MKRIIGGKRYDTDTALEVASWRNGASSSDFGCCREVLYRTKNGAYFIHGEGGAMSAWAESCDGGRSWCGGEGIRAMTPAEALEWLESHGTDLPDGCPEMSALVTEA